MVEVPRVRTCCCCIDLRTACVIIAALRIAMGIITIVAFFSVPFSNVFTEEKKNDALNSDDKGITVFFKILFYFWLFLVFILCFVNILFSYWFIRGIHSKESSKMKYYVIVVAINAVVFLLKFDLDTFVAALLEAYICICSYSVYVECSSQEGANENTVIRYDQVQAPLPPPYNSCNDNLKGSMQPSMQTSIQPSMQTSIQPSMQPTMQDQQQPGAYPKLYP